MGKSEASDDTRMTRRSVLCGAMATAAVAVARPVLAQQMQTHLPPGVEPKPKGPHVFLDYDKAEIDFAYDRPRGPPTEKKSISATPRKTPPRWPVWGHRVAWPTARPTSRSSTST
jgi:hypothetical protein